MLQRVVVVRWLGEIRLNPVTTKMEPRTLQRDGNDSTPVRGAIYEPIAQYYTAFESMEPRLGHDDVCADDESPSHRCRIARSTLLPTRRSFPASVDTHESTLFTLFWPIISIVIYSTQTQQSIETPLFRLSDPPEDVSTNLDQQTLIPAVLSWKDKVQRSQLRTRWAIRGTRGQRGA
jgi:hypothetical protein